MSKLDIFLNKTLELAGHTSHTKSAPGSIDEGMPPIPASFIAFSPLAFPTTFPSPSASPPAPPASGSEPMPPA